MQIQVQAGSRVGGGASLIENVTAEVEAALERFSAHITHIEVHMSDENGSKGGKDKRCVVEARMEGRNPVAVVDNADTIREAVTGAIHKLVRMLNSTVGKLQGHRKDLPQTS